uniref:uncharacterized protein LOC120327157 isoform X1 n=1 Tax=Styela clava TaxID=7725 RepID=UPI0019393FE3|nr:uncharacterized protein LOC120327157 isoform X1 [Styela clava]
MPRCCIPSCKRTTTSTHYFPKNEARRTRWIEFVQQIKPDFEPSPWVAICGAHFENNCFVRNFIIQNQMGFKNQRRILHDDAIPSLIDPDEAESSRCYYRKEVPVNVKRMRNIAPKPKSLNLNNNTGDSLAQQIPILFLPNNATAGKTTVGRIVIPQQSDKKAEENMNHSTNPSGNMPPSANDITSSGQVTIPFQIVNSTPSLIVNNQENMNHSINPSGNMPPSANDITSSGQVTIPIQIVNSTPSLIVNNQENMNLSTNPSGNMPPSANDITSSGQVAIPFQIVNSTPSSIVNKQTGQNVNFLSGSSSAVQNIATSQRTISMPVKNCVIKPIIVNVKNKFMNSIRVSEKFKAPPSIPSASVITKTCLNAKLTTSGDLKKEYHKIKPKGSEAKTELFTLDYLQQMPLKDLVDSFTSEVRLKMKNSDMKALRCKMGTCSFVISCPTINECANLMQGHMKRHLESFVEQTTRDPSSHRKLIFSRVEPDQGIEGESSVSIMNDIVENRMTNYGVQNNTTGLHKIGGWKLLGPTRKNHADKQRKTLSPKKYTLIMEKSKIAAEFAACPTQENLALLLQPLVNLLLPAETNPTTEDDDSSMPIITKIRGSVPREEPNVSQSEQTEIEKNCNNLISNSNVDFTSLFESADSSEPDNQNEKNVSINTNVDNIIEIKSEPSEDDLVNFNNELLSDTTNDSLALNSTHPAVRSDRENLFSGMWDLNSTHSDGRLSDVESSCDSQLDIRGIVEIENRESEEEASEYTRNKKPDKNETSNNIFSLLSESCSNFETTSDEEHSKSLPEDEDKSFLSSPSKINNTEISNTNIIDYGNIFENIERNVFDTVTTTQPRVNSKVKYSSNKVKDVSNNKHPVMQGKEAFLSILGLQKISLSKEEEVDPFVVKPPLFRTRLQKKTAVLERNIRKTKEQLTPQDVELEIQPLSQLNDVSKSKTYSKLKSVNRKHLQRRASLNHFLLNRLNDTPRGPCSIEYNDIKGYNLRRANLLKKRAHDQAKFNSQSKLCTNVEPGTKKTGSTLQRNTYNPVGEILRLPMEGILAIYEEEREFARKLSEEVRKQTRLKNDLDLEKQQEEERLQIEERMRLKAIPVEKLVPSDKIVYKRKLLPPRPRSPFNMPQDPLPITRKKRKKLKRVKSIPPPREIIVNGKSVLIKHEPVSDYEESSSSGATSNNESDEDINPVAKKKKLTVSSLLYQRRKKLVKPSDILLDTQSSSDNDDHVNYRDSGDDFVYQSDPSCHSDSDNSVEVQVHMDSNEPPQKEKRLVEIEKEAEDILAPLLTNQDIAIIGFTNDHSYYHQGEKMGRIQPIMDPYITNVMRGPTGNQTTLSESQIKERENALEYLKHLKYTENSRAEISTTGEQLVEDLVCKICQKRFSATNSLYYHYRSHAGVKPFKCDICAKSFTRLHSLNYHKMIHDNRTRFQCRYCGRGFRHPTHFKEHLHKHTGEEPYECSYCGRTFKTSNTLRRHKRRRNCSKARCQPKKTLPLSLSTAPVSPIQITSSSPPLPDSPPPPTLPIKPFSFPQGQAVKLVLFPKNGISRVQLCDD